MDLEVGMCVVENEKLKLVILLRGWLVVGSATSRKGAGCSESTRRPTSIKGTDGISLSDRSVFYMNLWLMIHHVIRETVSKS